MDGGGEITETSTLGGEVCRKTQSTEWCLLQVCAPLEVTHGGCWMRMMTEAITVQEKCGFKVCGCGASVVG